MSYSSRDSSNESKVYVGNLPPEIRMRDLEDVFYKYGKIVDVDLHNNSSRGGGSERGAPFAFVEFEDPRQVFAISPFSFYLQLFHCETCIELLFLSSSCRDAEDAVRGRDGYTFDGFKLRVEFPRGSSRGKKDYRDGGGGGGGGGGYRGRGGYGGGYGGGRGGGFSRGNRPKGYQLMISGLPATGSWQDVKDHFREAGDVIFADVYKDGSGIVEFSRHDHMKRALRDLDDSKFRSHEV